MVGSRQVIWEWSGSGCHETFKTDTSGWEEGGQLRASHELSALSVSPALTRVGELPVWAAVPLVMLSHTAVGKRITCDSM